MESRASLAWKANLFSSRKCGTCVWPSPTAVPTMKAIYFGAGVGLGHAASEYHRRRFRPPAGSGTKTDRSGWCSTARSTTFGNCAGIWRAADTSSTTHTDTETIVHLYEEYGKRAVDHLRGMFAFALWDERKRQLLIARDRVGIKPLYYAEAGGRLLFASELKSILQVAGMESAT